MMFSKNRPKAGRVYLTELDRDEIIAKLEKRLTEVKEYKHLEAHHNVELAHADGQIRELRYALRLLRGMR